MAFDKLQEFISQASPKTVNLYEALVSSGFGRTFEKYLRTADFTALATFFDDLARAELNWLLEHRAALFAPPIALDASALEPPPVKTITPDDLGLYAEKGLASLRAGEWAALVFAGGSATRFYVQQIEGKDSESVSKRPLPKGLFPICPVSRYSFLELFVSQALATAVMVGRLPYFLILVSANTEAPIAKWLDESDVWGYPKDLILLVRQAMHPRLDMEGDLIAMPNGHLSWTGDGHGGAFAALLRKNDGQSSIAARLRAAGIRHLVVHNVDNALARAFEPTRLGVHIHNNALLTISTVPRRGGDEKVGLVLYNRKSGKIEVVEYSQCPPEVANAVLPDGRPLFNLAHICTNLISIDAIRPDLPRTLYVNKKIKVGDIFVLASSLEMLNQDLARLLDPSTVQVLLLERENFFLPTKNATGPDSIETTMAGLNRYHRDLLRALGADVAESSEIEIAPWAIDLFQAKTLRWRIGERARLFIAARYDLDTNGLPSDLDIGEGATVSIEAKMPYGDLRADVNTREVLPDPETAGHLVLGSGVSFAPHSVLRIKLGRSSRLIIEDGAKWSNVLEAQVPPADCWVIRKDGTLSRGLSH